MPFLLANLHDLIILADIWKAFRIHRNLCFCHINVICANLRNPRPRALQMCQVYSNCNAIFFSWSFLSRQKKISLADIWRDNRDSSLIGLSVLIDRRVQHRTVHRQTDPILPHKFLLDCSPNDSNRFQNLNFQNQLVLSYMININT